MITIRAFGGRNASARAGKYVQLKARQIYVHAQTARACNHGALVGRHACNGYFSKYVLPHIRISGFEIEGLENRLIKACQTHFTRMFGYIRNNSRISSHKSSASKSLVRV